MASVNQFLVMTKDIESLKSDTALFKDILREHGSQLRELYRMVSFASTKAELNVAISSVRAQYLNGHMPTATNTDASSRLRGLESDQISHSLDIITELNAKFEQSEKERKEKERASANRITLLEKELKLMKMNQVEANLRSQEKELQHSRKLEAGWMYDS